MLGPRGPSVRQTTRSPFRAGPPVKPYLSPRWLGSIPKIILKIILKVIAKISSRLS
jgi:hypothetical protein